MQILFRRTPALTMQLLLIQYTVIHLTILYSFPLPDSFLLFVLTMVDLTTANRFKPRLIFSTFDREKWSKVLHEWSISFLVHYWSQIQSTAKFAPWTLNIKWTRTVMSGENGKFSIQVCSRICSPISGLHFLTLF